LGAARARHHPRRDVVLAPVPGGARAARAGLRGLLVRLALRGRGAGRALPRHAWRQPRGRDAGRRDRARPLRDRRAGGGRGLAGGADPALGVALADVLGEADVMVDFTRPDTALENVRTAVAAGVHAVVGTSGWDVDAAKGLSGANVFFAPNFAIGAVLMMRFAAEAARHMAKAEIVELHHDGKLDAPSGTAKPTAEMMAGEVPIHSVRLPGLVAHQEVILGD